MEGVSGRLGCRTASGTKGKMETISSTNTSGFRRARVAWPDEGGAGWELGIPALVGPLRVAPRSSRRLASSPRRPGGPAVARRVAGEIERQDAVKAGGPGASIGVGFGVAGSTGRAVAAVFAKIPARRPSRLCVVQPTHLVGGCRVRFFERANPVIRRLRNVARDSERVLIG